MNKHELLQIIDDFKDIYKTTSIENEYIVIERIEKIIDEYLKNNPYDTEIWILQALLVYESPLNDLMKTINCLKKVLIFDPNNTTAALFLGYVYEYSSYIPEDFFHKLLNIKSDNNEIASMIEFVKYFYYRYKENNELIEQTLLQSIALCSNHVWNNIKLDQFYLQNKQIDKAKDYIFQGFNNIQYVYHKEDFKQNFKYNPFDIEEFFNERIKGTHLSWVNYDSIKETFDYICELYFAPERT